MSEKTEALPPIPEKHFFTIGEAADLVGVAPSVLRFWEKEFRVLAPGRHGGRRRYEHKDILKAREIRSLLYDKKYTLAGAKKILRKRPVKEIPAPEDEDRELLDNLIGIRNSIKDFLL